MRVLRGCSIRLRRGSEAAIGPLACNNRPALAGVTRSRGFEIRTLRPAASALRKPRERVTPARSPPLAKRDCSDLATHLLGALGLLGVRWESPRGRRVHPLVQSL